MVETEVRREIGGTPLRPPLPEESRDITSLPTVVKRILRKIRTGIQPPDLQPTTHWINVLVRYLILFLTPR